MFRKMIGLVCLFALSLTACGQTTLTPTNPDNTPSNPVPQPETFAVTGVALDTQGKPIANAKVWIEPAVTTGLAETTTDAKGVYKMASLPNVPYYAKAWTFVEYNGENFCLRLGMPKASDYGSFTVEHGVVRNFQWQLSGVIEDLKEYDGYFGAEIRLFIDGDMKDGEVELTFTPTAPLVDGSQGQVITRKLNVNKALMVYDIPLGQYEVSGVLLENGTRTPLHVGAESVWDGYNAQTETAALEFNPNGCGNGNGIDRAFLYLNSPYAW
jgi:Carboxypeptidase regulatory-like domain